MNSALSGKLGTTLNSGNILVGNGSNVAAGVTMSGDVTIDNTGATTIGNSKVTLGKIVNIANNTILGNNSGSAGAPSALTASQIKTILGIGTSDVSGLGTMATQSASNVFVTGGQISGVTVGGTASGLSIAAGSNTISGLAASNFTSANISQWTNDANYLTANQSISLSGDLSGSGTTSINATIGNGAVSLSKMANLAANSIIGNNTGSPTTPVALTASQVKTLLGISTSDISGLGTMATQSASNIFVTGGQMSGLTSISATTFTGALSGNATSASTATTATTANALANSDSAGQSAITAINSASNGTINSARIASLPYISTTLTSGNILVGNGSNVATGVTMSGDATIDNTGALTIGNSKVTLAKMANMATASLLGRNSGGTGAPEVLSASTVKSLLGIGTSDISGLGSIATESASSVYIAGGQIKNVAIGGTASGLTIAAGTNTISGLSASNFTSGNISQWTNDSNYLTANQSISLSGDLSGSGTTSINATIGNGAVSLSKMANLAANSIIGNNTGSPTTPIALTASQVKTLLGIGTSDVSGLGTMATQSASNIFVTGGQMSGLTSISATTFTGALSGNASTVTDGVYTTGSYSNPNWITALSPTKVLPDQTGQNGKVLSTNGSTLSWVTNSSGVAWGAITGNLSDQSDLNSALSGKLGTGLTSGNIFVGNGSGVATGVSMSGDVTIDNTGATTIGNSKVTLGKIANIANNTILGNNSGDVGAPSALTASQIKTILGIGTSDVSGLGTMATQSASNVFVTGGQISGVTVGGTASGLSIAAGSNTISGLSASNFTSANISQWTNDANYLTANQSISLSGDLSGSGTTSINATIGNGAVSLSKMANLAANSIIGNNTGSPTTPVALTAAQVKTLLGISTSDISGLGTMATQSASNIFVTGGQMSGLTSISATTFTGALSGNATSATTANALANSDSAGQSAITAINSASTGTINSARIASLPYISTTLSSGNIIVGNGSSVATGVTMSGDVTIDNTGATTIGNSKVTLGKIANIANNTILGNNSGSSGPPIALTASQIKTVLGISTSDVSGLGTMATQSASNVFVTGGQISGVTVGGTASGLSISAGTNTVSGLTASNMTAGDFSTAITSGTYTISVSSASTAGSASTVTGLSVTSGKTLTVQKSMTFTAADDSGIYTLPTGTKTLAATDVTTLSSLTSVGTLSSLGVSGAITGATSTNTINGMIINSGAVSGVTTLAASGTTTVGSGGNTFTFDPTSGPTYAGTARPTKRISLSPEYAGAALTGDGSSNTGTMTSDNAGAAGGYRNYYKWTTTQGTNQDYDIFVRIPLPMDFGAMAGTPTLSIDTYSSDTTNGTVTINVFDTNGTAAGSACTNASFTPTSTTTWQTKTSSTCLNSGTFTAGGTMTIDIKMQSPTSGDVRVGNIQFDYLSKF